MGAILVKYGASCDIGPSGGGPRMHAARYEKANTPEHLAMFGSRDLALTIGAFSVCYRQETRALPAGILEHP